MSSNELAALLHVAITERTPAGWEHEDSCSWATDASVLRAHARREAETGRRPSELVAVERHLRKLARSMAVTRTAVTVRDADGGSRIVRFVKNRRAVNVRDADGELRVVRLLKDRGDGAGYVTGPDSMVVRRGYQHVNQATGEITWKTRTQRGQYAGGSGYLIVNDGRVTAASIAKLLGAPPAPDPYWRCRRDDYGLIS